MSRNRELFFVTAMPFSYTACRGAGFPMKCAFPAKCLVVIHCREERGDPDTKKKHKNMHWNASMGRRATRGAVHPPPYILPNGALDAPGPHATEYSGAVQDRQTVGLPGTGAAHRVRGDSGTSTQPEGGSDGGSDAGNGGAGPALCTSCRSSVRGKGPRDVGGAAARLLASAPLGSMGGGTGGQAILRQKKN